MAINTKVVLKATEGDVVLEHIKTTVQASFDYFMKLSMPLTASTSVNVDIPFTTIEFLYVEVETDDATVWVHKDGEGSYQAITSQLLLNGIEITQLDLTNPGDDCTVFLYMGGR
jgi:hypothetical protein